MKLITKNPDLAAHWSFWFADSSEFRRANCLSGSFLLVEVTCKTLLKLDLHDDALRCFPKVLKSWMKIVYFFNNLSNWIEFPSDVDRTETRNDLTGAHCYAAEQRLTLRRYWSEMPLKAFEMSENRIETYLFRVNKAGKRSHWLEFLLLK